MTHVISNHFPPFTKVFRHPAGSPEPQLPMDMTGHRIAARNGTVTFGDLDIPVGTPIWLSTGPADVWDGPWGTTTLDQVLVQADPNDDAVETFARFLQFGDTLDLSLRADAQHTALARACLEATK